MIVFFVTNRRRLACWAHLQIRVGCFRTSCRGTCAGPMSTKPILDLRPIVEANDRFVFLEAHTLADKAHVVLRKLGQNVLHGADGVHQQRDAVDRDLEAHVGELGGFEDRRAAALQHVCHLWHIKLPCDPLQLYHVVRRLDEDAVGAGREIFLGAAVGLVEPVHVARVECGRG